MVHNVARIVAEQPMQKAAIATVVAFVTYFLPGVNSRELFIWAMSFIVLDTVTGVWASYKTGIPIESMRFARLIEKTKAYLVLVIVAAGAGRLADMSNNSGDLVVSFGLGFVMATEGLSILENLNRIGIARVPALERIFKGVTDGRPEETGGETRDQMVD